MCGILGIVSKGKIDKKNLEEATIIMNHRGADDFGVFLNSELRTGNSQYNVGLGHTRLSIIDLSPAGHQPMSNEQQNIWIVYNGEIYNFQSIRKELEVKGHKFKSKTDTEVIIHSYEEWGVDCLQKFNAMFAFAIWDNKNQELFIARDRLGIKPLYYTITGDTLIFASEIKAILSTNLISPEPDWKALHNPWNFLVAPNTGFSNIKKLPPGHLGIFKNGDLRIKKYWNVEIREESINEKEGEQKLAELIRDSVRLQMVADVPIGALLSGGLDSSTIVGIMSQFTADPVHTFTIRFTDEDKRFESMPDDSRYAKIVSKQFHTNHHEISLSPKVVELLPKIIWHLDEPISDPAAINTFLISQSAREEGAVVLLSGMGGDEIFGGYRKYLACLLAERYQSFLPKGFRSSIEKAAANLPVASKKRGFRVLRWGKRFLSFASLPPLERFMQSDLSMSPCVYNSLYAQSSKFPYNKLYTKEAYNRIFADDTVAYLTRMMLADTRTFLPEHNLLYSDKASMAAGVESRPPLIDHRIVEYMFSLSPQYKIRGRTQKYLFKKSMEWLLTKEIIYRPKAPFGSPLRSWIRNQLKEMVDDLLAPSVLRRRGLYHPEYVWKKIKNDRSGKEDNSLLIWNLLSSEIWFQIFIDGGWRHFSSDNN